MRFAGAAIALALLVAAFVVDGPVDRWVADHRSVGWEVAAKFCSRYSAWPWLMLIAALGVVIAWRSKRPDWVRVLCVMMIAASLAGLAADILRAVTGRTRPYVQARQGFYGIHDGSQWLLTEHAYNSFPSGHTAAITGFLVPLVAFRRRVAWTAVPIICLVGAARIYVGAHHPSDIVVGAVLGTCVAVIALRRAAARS